MVASSSGRSPRLSPDFFSASTRWSFPAPKKQFRRFGDSVPACTALPWPRRFTAPSSVPCSGAGPRTDSAARPRCFGSAFFTLSGAVGSGLATNVAMFIVARVIGGLGIGISTVVAPMYISEIAPPKHRGRLAGMFQFNIVFGILIAFVSNALLAGIGENAWRWMLGVAAFPSLLYAAFCIGLPESPRWLLSRKGDREAGLEVLQRIEPEVSASRNRSRGRHNHRRIVRKSIVRTFLDDASAQTHPARHLDCLLQPTLRHQCDSVLRAAHL